MESITLIPWIADGESHRVSGGLDDLPLTDEGADNGYTLLSLEVGPTQSTATFQSSGILGESDVYNPEFNLLDREGSWPIWGERIWSGPGRWTPACGP